MSVGAKRHWKIHTSSTGAVCSIAVATLGTSSDDLTIDVLGIVDIDVAGAATAVRNFDGHGW